MHVVMLLQADPETTLISLSGDALEQAERLARELTRAQVFNMMNQLFELEERLKQSTQARFLVEFTFLRMAVIKPIVPIDEVMARLKSLPGKDSPG